MRQFLLLVILLSQATQAFSQKKSIKETDPDLLIQELLQQEELPANYEEVYDLLYQYYSSPLELNRAGREELEGLYLLTPIEINSLIEYTARYGTLVSIYELQAIPNWTMAAIRKVLPFVTVEQHFDHRTLLKRFLHNPNHFLTFRTDRVLNTRKGYQTDKEGKINYAGSPYRHQVRYRNSIGRDFSLGFILEKDPGEALVWNPASRQYLADYISFHVSLFNKGKWKAISIGDYKVQFGQGLALGGGFYIGKSAETILSVKRNSRGIMPYSSVMETGFFRGGGLTYCISKQAELTGFYSNNNRDAALKYDTIEQNQIASSFADYGMHRTVEEINSKRNINEQVLGGNISVHSKNKKLQAGVSFVHTAFNKMIIKTDRLYNRFDFKGNQNTVIAADYSWLVRNFNLFGEGAVSSGGGKAFVIGGIGSLSSRIDFSFLYRSYDRNFHSFYSNAFAESSSAANEKGAYWGLRIKLNSKWTWSGYYDYFVFPWLKYLKDNPTEGYGYLARLQYIPSKKVLLYAQWRFQEAEKNQSGNLTPIDYTVPSRKYNYMLNLEYKAGAISLRSRVQGSRYRQSNGPTSGFVLSQDFGWDFRKVKISTRYCLFDTEDYENRQYLYEKDVLYSVTFPAYDGKGTRTYLILQLKPGKHTDVWLRYSVTGYTNRQTISSGWEEIKGNKIRELKVQLRYRFG